MASQDCTICCTPASRICPTCKSTVYCSVECSSTDEPLHSLLCASYAVFRLTPRPSDKYHVGLLFPTTGPPSFFWATWKMIPFPKLGYGNMDPQLQVPLSNPSNDTSRNLLSWNCYRQYDAGHTLAFYRPLHAPTTPNQFIDSITAGKNVNEKWTGPVVMLAFEDQTDALEHPFRRDINMTDFRIAVDYFMYGDEPLENQIESPWNIFGMRNQVLGVKFYCEAERNGEKFEVVKVPRDHPVFESSPTPISQAMEMPLLMWKDPHAEIKGGKGYLNLEVSSMNRITDMTDRSWGNVPKDWRGEIGSVLVVRQDCKDLKAEEFKAMKLFCTELLDVLISQTRNSAGYSRECLVQEFMDYSTFELWLSVRRLRMEKKGVNERLANPY